MVQPTHDTGNEIDLSLQRPRKRRGKGSTPALILAPFFVVAVAGGMLMLSGAGMLGTWSRDTPLFIVGGAIGLFLVLTLAPIAWLLAGSMRQRSNDKLTAQVEEINLGVQVLHQQAVLSDDARRVLNRRAERDLLCRTIETDIEAEEWDAGVVLCKELSERFGYRAEAEEYRSRIEQARATVVDHRVTDAVAHLDGLIVQRKWDDAQLEAGRIMRLYPESPRVENLRRRVEQASGVYKSDLERRFLDHARNDDVDEAMTLLKELDAYLTEEEAAPYREVARGVIGKARDNLGARFKIAVQDKQWPEAATIGRKIIAEFPNTRMATEVRHMLDKILTKANAESRAPAGG